MKPNRRGLLIVDHGTRVPAANERLAAFTQQVAAARPDWHVRYAHMELAEPGFADGIESLIADGALTIHVHLHFLSAGFHIRETIPELVAAARGKHPGVEISLSEPLGDDPRLVDIVLSRMDLHKE
jgi:sirohydrochlorin ferrochelatase